MMSFEYCDVSGPCPCGKGKVTWESGDDDWGRYYDRNYEIACPECKERFSIELLDGAYCVPKELLPIKPPWRAPMPENYVYSLIQSYPKKDLIRFLDMLNEYSSFKQIRDYYFRRVVNSCYKYEQTRKLTFVRLKLSEAIGEYDQVCNHDLISFKDKEYYRYKRDVIEKSFFVRRAL